MRQSLGFHGDVVLEKAYLNISLLRDSEIHKRRSRHTSQGYIVLQLFLPLCPSSTCLGSETVLQAFIRVFIHILIHKTNTD